MAYTFNITPYGTVEVFNDGQRVATTTEDNAKLNYGYGGTQGQSPIAASTSPSPVNTAPVQQQSAAPATTTPAPVDTNYQVKAGESAVAYNTRIAAYRASNATTPAQSPISNPIQPPASSSSPGTPALPTGQAGSTLDNFNASLASSVDSTRAAFDAATKSRADAIQGQIDQLKTSQAAAKQGEEGAMNTIGDVAMNEAKDKSDALTLEKQRVDDNYNANQGLIGELDSLLTTGNNIISGMKATTGLASIMNPRISQTMADVTARAGVIQTLLSARDNQIGVAQNQLSSTLGALTSIYGDQINYYKSVVSFYDKQSDTDQSQITSLTAEQKTYLDAKINSLSEDMENAKSTANIIRQAMVDPAKATAYAKAGVSLTDSPQEIATKLATYGYSQELSNISNTMAEKGYSTTAIAGVTPVTITDSSGKNHQFYKSATSSDGSFTLGSNQIRFDANGNVIASGPQGASDTDTSGLKLTAAKFAGGAANAGVTVDEFKQLDPLIQNFYANQQPVVSALNKSISDVSSGKQSADAVKAQIDQSNQPDVVKQHLKDAVDAATPANSGGFWSSVGNFFKGALDAVSG